MGRVGFLRDILAFEWIYLHHRFSLYFPIYNSLSRYLLDFWRHDYTRLILIRFNHPRFIHSRFAWYSILPAFPRFPSRILLFWLRLSLFISVVSTAPGLPRPSPLWSLLSLRHIDFDVYVEVHARFLKFMRFMDNLFYHRFFLLFSQFLLFFRSLLLLWRFNFLFWERFFNLFIFLLLLWLFILFIFRLRFLFHFYYRLFLDFDFRRLLLLFFNNRRQFGHRHFRCLWFLFDQLRFFYLLLRWLLFFH